MIDELACQKRRPVGGQEVQVPIPVVVGEAGADVRTGRELPAGACNLHEAPSRLLEERGAWVERADKEIEVAVAVDVRERRPRRVLARERHAELLGSLAKGAVPFVEKEEVATRVAADDVEVGPAVAVDISPRCSAGDLPQDVDPGIFVPMLHGDSRRFGHVGK